MFDKNQSRIIFILGLSGVLFSFISFFTLSEIPVVEFKFPLQKDEVFNKADRFISLLGISSKPLIKKSEILSNQEGIIYLQKTFDTEKANKFLKSLPLYFWQMDYVYLQDRKIIRPFRNKKQLNRILLSPINGKVIGFSRSMPEEQYNYPRILSKNESERIANVFFDLIDFDISSFKMTKYSPIERKYIFEWEKVEPEIKLAKLKVHLEIFGNTVGNFYYFLEILPKELKKFQSNNLLTFLISIILNLIVIALGIFTLIISIINRKKLNWRFGLVFALLMLISFLIYFLKIENYRGLYLFLFLFFSILTCIIYFFWTMIVACVSKIFAKQSGIDMFPLKISFSIILSYIFVFSGIGVTMFTFIFIQKIFKPVSTLGFYSFFSEFPSAKISCLIAPLLSLNAAVSEEIFFRALMITFLSKYFKKTVWIIVLTSLIWSFIHVSPFGYSDVYPNFVKGIVLLPMGILLGYVFIRFGLFCAITTHYLHDLIVIGLAFLEFSNFRYVYENIITMLIAAILPLIIAIYFRIGNHSV